MDKNIKDSLFYKEKASSGAFEYSSECCEYILLLELMKDKNVLSGNIVSTMGMMGYNVSEIVYSRVGCLIKKYLQIKIGTEIENKVKLFDEYKNKYIGKTKKELSNLFQNKINQSTFDMLEMLTIKDIYSNVDCTLKIYPNVWRYIFSTLKIVENYDQLLHLDNYFNLIKIEHYNDALQDCFKDKTLLELFTILDYNNIKDLKNKSNDFYYLMFNNNFNEYNNVCKLLSGANTIEQDLNEYYYCTKTIKVLKEKIYESTLEYFKIHSVTTAIFNDIYNYLQKKLGIFSVNRANLAKVLGTVGKEIKLNDIENAYELHLKIFGKHGEIYIPKDVVMSVNKIILYSTFNYVSSILTYDNVLTDSLKKDGLIVSFVKNPLFTKFEPHFIQFLKSLEEEVKQQILNNSASLDALFIEYLGKIANQRFKDEFVDLFIKLKNCIPFVNYDMKLSYFVDGKDYDILKNYNLLRVKDLFNIPNKQIITLINDRKFFIDLLTRLSVNYPQKLQEEYTDCLMLKKQKMAKPNKQWIRDTEMLKLRGEGNVLESIGQKYSLTRERVRQIEKKHTRFFKNLYYSFDKGLLRFLKAFSKSKDYITIDEIKSIVSDNSDVFIFLLSNIEVDEIEYIEELNVFRFDSDINWYEELVTTVSKLPDTIGANNINSTIEETYKFFKEFDIDIPIEFVDKVFKSNYIDNGLVFSKNKLSLVAKYLIIIKDHFKDGIDVYDENELDKLRAYYKKMYKDDKIPDNNRALTSRVTSALTLCAKGRYKYISDFSIYNNVLDDICKYIDLSDKPIFITNTLFNLFEDELVKVGIDNKYFLQGLIHKYAHNKYYFKRDYISKTKDVTNLRQSIVDLVKNAQGVVLKADILKEFPGLPDIVLMFALQDDEIINGGGIYISKERILEKGESLDNLTEIIENLVNDGGIHSSTELMDVINLQHHEIIDDYSISNKYYLFSIVESLFSEDYSLSRPFMAKKGVHITNEKERVIDYIDNQSNEFETDDFIGYMRDNAFLIINTLDSINQYNDYIMLKDKDTLIKLNKIGINSNIVKYVEDYLDSITHGDDFIVLDKIFNSRALPQINISWNEWLIYSIITKWSNKYTMVLSSDQFRFSLPVAVKKDINISSRDELVLYLKNKLQLNDIDFQNYLLNKKLVKK